MSFQAHGADMDAILTDRYLDALLAARDRRAVDSPADADLDPAIRLAASRLAADLDRVHPSFRFEERLAARLAAMAARMRLGLAAGGEGSRVTADPVDRRPGTQADPALDALLADALGAGFDPAAAEFEDGDPGRFARPLI
ncbi:MAG TPA: hypothetical protein VK656_00460, partial [Candidatus Acidoferrum sp.]|nr:hypothetical protein [Candidatus Acidoferrum sp.]